MAGGFNAGVTGSRIKVEEEIIGEGEAGIGDSGDEAYAEWMEIDEDWKAGVIMEKLTLGGRIKPSVDGDPVYMLGAFRESRSLPEIPPFPNRMFLFSLARGLRLGGIYTILLTLSDRCADELHLAPLSAVVQLRPQLHHLDAFDEVSVKNKALLRARRDLDGEARPRPAEPEARAIDMKVKSAESGNANLAGNNESLKRIQDERWQRYSWIDENVSRQENPPPFSSFHAYRVLTYGVRNKLGPRIMG